MRPCTAQLTSVCIDEAIALLKKFGWEKIHWPRDSDGNILYNTLLWGIWVDGTPMTKRKGMTAISVELLNEVDGLPPAHTVFSVGQHSGNSPATRAYLRLLSDRIDQLSARPAIIHGVALSCKFFGKADGKMAALLLSHAGAGSLAPSPFAAIRRRREFGDPAWEIGLKVRYRLGLQSGMTGTEV